MFSCQASRSTTYGVGKARVNHSGKSHSVKLIPPKFMAGPVQSGTYVCKIVRVVDDKKIRISVEIMRAVSRGR